MEEAALARGLDVDEFALRLSFFFNAHNDFFEEIAKYRRPPHLGAGHAREMAPKSRRAWLMRFTPRPPASARQHSSRRTTSCTRSRRWRQCWAVPSRLHTNSMDEALALPPRRRSRSRWRTQQIIAGPAARFFIPSTCWAVYVFVEALTDRMEAEANAYFRSDSAVGRRGSGPSSTASSSVRSPTRPTSTSARSMTGRRTIVGVNDYVANELVEVLILAMDPMATTGKWRYCAAGPSARLSGAADAPPPVRCRATRVDQPDAPILECVEAYATLGRSATSSARCSENTTSRCTSNTGP